jgi:hypothetical protein
MKLEEYTADAICHAVNLSGFVEPAWAEREHPTLRIVLTPSFHPEVCITISRAESGASISVIVLAERFWIIGPAAGIVTNREETSVQMNTFEEWLKLFNTARTYVEEGRKCLCIDGMSLECCLISRVCSQRFKAHVYQLQDGVLLAGVLDFAWRNCKNPRVRNGLSDAACYLGLKFPIQEIPPDPPTSRIAVLGTPEARKEYFEMLQQVIETKAKQ